MSLDIFPISVSSMNPKHVAARTREMITQTGCYFLVEVPKAYFRTSRVTMLAPLLLTWS